MLFFFGGGGWQFHLYMVGTCGSTFKPAGLETQLKLILQMGGDAQIFAQKRGNEPRNVVSGSHG